VAELDAGSLKNIPRDRCDGKLFVRMELMKAMEFNLGAQVNHDHSLEMCPATVSVSDHLSCDERSNWYRRGGSCERSSLVVA